jgi:hypothetical protein
MDRSASDFHVPCSRGSSFAQPAARTQQIVAMNALRFIIFSDPTLILSFFQWSYSTIGNKEQDVVGASLDSGAPVVFLPFVLLPEFLFLFCLVVKLADDFHSHSSRHQTWL